MYNYPDIEQLSKFNSDLSNSIMIELGTIAIAHDNVLYACYNTWFHAHGISNPFNDPKFYEYLSYIALNMLQKRTDQLLKHIEHSLEKPVILKTVSLIDGEDLS